MTRATTAALAVVLMIAGCAMPVRNIKAAEGPAVEVLSLDPELYEGARLWAAELSERFDNPLLVSCHGGPKWSNGEWYLWPAGDRVPLHAETVAQVLHELYPDRPIVFICCNKDGTPIRVAGVYYAKNKVSVYPHWGRPGWITDAGGFVEGSPSGTPSP